jgi:hypothetical protein
MLHPWRVRPEVELALSVRETGGRSLSLAGTVRPGVELDLGVRPRRARLQEQRSPILRLRAIRGFGRVCDVTRDVCIETQLPRQPHLLVARARKDRL